MSLPIIHDGDHGGDDFITTLLFCAYPEHFNLLGITSVLGNTGAVQAAKNAALALGFAKRGDVPVCIGKNKPYKIDYKLGDDAFGSSGLGDVSVPDSIVPAKIYEDEDGVSWMARTLKASLKKITICATGPLTNIAHLLVEHPDAADKIEQIIIMGGGVNPAGNIKPYAEFNFYMDPDAADLVLNSGIKIVLHSLDSTQQAIYSPARQEVLKERFKASPHTEWLDGVMRITEDLEFKSFGVLGSFFHDHQVCAYLAMPDNYEVSSVSGRVLSDDTGEGGKLVVTPAKDGAENDFKWVQTNKDTERFFEFLLTGFERIL